MEKLGTLGRAYSRLVFTRSDFVYLCTEWLPEPNDRIYVLGGESFGGLMDTHTVFPWDMWREGLNVSMWLAHASKPDFCIWPSECARWGVPFFDDYKLAAAKTRYNNLEMLLALYYAKMGLPVELYRRVQFTVRRPDSAVDNASRSAKSPSSRVPAKARRAVADLGLVIKYARLLTYLCACLHACVYMHARTCVPSVHISASKDAKVLLHVAHTCDLGLHIK